MLEESVVAWEARMPIVTDASLLVEVRSKAIYTFCMTQIAAAAFAAQSYRQVPPVAGALVLVSIPLTTFQLSGEISVSM